MIRDHLFPSYAPADVQFVEGRGSWLTDDAGRRYLDFISGISVNALGHAHPDLVGALETQARKLWHLSNMFNVPGQEELAARYCELTFADRVFFTNSGTEAVECALKSARKYHAAAGQEERTTIIGFEGAFHGRTYASVNAAGNPKYLEGFGPALPGYRHAVFNDIASVEALLDETSAAVIIEPIQGEGGLRAADLSFLERLRGLCSERGVLLIYDEVQCGAGRTGRLFAHQWSDQAAPDLLAAAKGIGGGFPLGMCLATEAVARNMVPGTHGTTYGGNALACAVGAAMLDHLADPAFMATVRETAEALHSGLKRIADLYPGLVLDVRGKGLLCGFKVGRATNLGVRNQARELGLLVGVAGDNTVRLAPPLNSSAEEVETALSILGNAVEMLSQEQTELEPAK